MNEFWTYLNGHGEGFFFFCLFVVLPALLILANCVVGVARAVMRVPVHNHYHEASEDDDADGDEDDDDQE